MEDNIQSLTKENQALKKKVSLLEQKLDVLIRKLYGKSSEKVDPNQLELLGLDADEPGKDEASAANVETLLAEAEAAKPKKNKRERKPRIPEDLPLVEETVIDPDAVKAEPEAWRRIGEEVTELLDYEPGRFVRRRIIRPTYVKRADNAAPPITAQQPALLVEGGILAPGLLAHIVIAKYCDHLPLYRQEQIYKERHAVYLPRQTLCRWISMAAFWCRPIYEQIAREMFAQNYLQGDETPVRYLQPGSGKAQLGYLWTYNVPGGDTLYDWHASRGHQCLVARLGLDFSGTLQCDGYGAYQTYARLCEDVTLAGCWAHARRKFYDAREQYPVRAFWILRQIGHLYKIEARLRESNAGPALREAVRCAESVPIVHRIQRALFRFRADPRCLPQGLLGHLEKVRQIAKQCVGHNARVLIDRLNPVLRGWANYHRHIAAKGTFADVDYHVHRAIFRWAKRTHPKKKWHWIYGKYFLRPNPASGSVFTAKTKDKNGKIIFKSLYKCASTKIVRRVKIRMHANPFDPAQASYFAMGAKSKGMRETGKS